MTASKISPELQEKLKSVKAGEQVEVIVQLQRPHVPETGSRQERIGELQRAFTHAIEQLTLQNPSAMGTILETAWINSTARCLATPDQIRALESLPAVLAVDLPAGIHPQ